MQARIDEKKDALASGGWILDEDGWDIEAVFDFNDADNDELRERRCWFDGLDIVVRTVDWLDLALIIFRAVTFRFFFDGDTIVDYEIWWLITMLVLKSVDMVIA